MLCEFALQGAATRCKPSSPAARLMRLTVSPKAHGGADARVEHARLEEGLAAGAGFQVGAELCEGRHLAGPCELTLQGASNLD